MSITGDDALTERLLEHAIAARQRAYAPYSGHPVGACLETEAGELHAGCNVENAAYPNGHCAETAAIAAMVLAGGRRIRRILIAGPDGGLCTPCGACRQRLVEFGGPELLVEIGDAQGVRLVTTLGELLPFAFANGSGDHSDSGDVQEG